MGSGRADSDVTPRGDRRWNADTPGQVHRPGMGRLAPAAGYSLSPAVIWVADSAPSEASAASGHTQSVNAGWS